MKGPWIRWTLRGIALLVVSPGLAPAPAHAHSSPGRLSRGIKVPQIEDLKAAIDQLPGQAFDRRPFHRKAALAGRLDAVGRQIVIGRFKTAHVRLRRDVLARADGCLGGRARNDWIVDCAAQQALADHVDALLAQLARPVFSECAAKDTLAPLLREAMGQSMGSFSLLKIDASEFADRVKSQSPLDVPLVAADGRTYFTFDRATPEASRAASAVQGFLKPLQLASPVPLGPELGWRVGCTDPTGTCGFLGFLDEQRSRPEGLIVHPSTGSAFFEPAEDLLASVLGQRPDVEPGCHVFYNVRRLRIPLGFEEDGLEDAGPPTNPSDSPRPSMEDAPPLRHTIPITLDGDARFYQLDPATVWRRQASVIGSVNLIYHLIEPLSSGKLDIRFEIAGQEAWLPGFGPTNTLSDGLTDEINAPDYVMVRHPANDEVSYFFVGYDMNGGVGGQAGGLCGYDGVDPANGLPWDRTFGSDFEHQWNHAWGQQVPDEDRGYEFSTLYGRVVVAAHELGHMLGALHSRGANDVCAAPSGPWSRLCGTSLMKSGAAGGVAPDFRQPFFSDANDDGIVSCVRRVVP